MNPTRQKGMHSGGHSPWSNEGTRDSRGRPPRSPSISLKYPVPRLNSPTSWRFSTDTMFLGVIAASPSPRHFVHTSAESAAFSDLSASPSPNATIHFPPVPDSYGRDLAMAHFYNHRSSTSSYLNFQLPSDNKAVEVQKKLVFSSGTSKLSVKGSSVKVGTEHKPSQLSASSHTFVPSNSTLAKLEKNDASSRTVVSNSSVLTSTSTTRFLKDTSRSQFEPPHPKGADLEAMVEVLLKLVDEPDASVKRKFKMTHIFAFCPRPGYFVVS